MVSTRAAQRFRFVSLGGIALVFSAFAADVARAQHEEQVAAAALPYATRQVHVVQPRAVPKKHALELAATAGVIPTDPLRVYFPLGVRAAFHLGEVWAIEASFAYLLAAQTSLAEELSAAGADPRAWQREPLQLRADAALRVAPLYGKLLAGSSVLHVELYALAGAGIVRTLGAPALDQRAALRPVGLLAGGLGFLFGRRWVVRLEYRQAMVARPSGSLGWPGEIGLAGGVLLGGRR